MFFRYCETFGAKGSRCYKSSKIVAYWNGENGEICPFNSMYSEPRPGEIIYFMKHLLYVGEECYEHVLCFVDWFKMLPNPNECNYYGKPIKLCYENFHDLGGPASFMPIQRIKAKFVSIPERKFSKDVLVILPRYRTLNL